MDEAQARKVLADATAPPMPGPGQFVDPPEVHGTHREATRPSPSGPAGQSPARA